MFRTWETDITDEVWMLNIPLFSWKRGPAKSLKHTPFFAEFRTLMCVMYHIEWGGWALRSYRLLQFFLNICFTFDQFYYQLGEFELWRSTPACLVCINIFRISTCLLECPWAFIIRSYKGIFFFSKAHWHLLIPKSSHATKNWIKATDTEYSGVHICMW